MEVVCSFVKRCIRPAYAPRPAWRTAGMQLAKTSGMPRLFIVIIITLMLCPPVHAEGKGPMGPPPNEHQDGEPPRPKAAKQPAVDPSAPTLEERRAIAVKKAAESPKAILAVVEGRRGLDPGKAADELERSERPRGAELDLRARRALYDCRGAGQREIQVRGETSGFKAHELARSPDVARRFHGISRALSPLGRTSRPTPRFFSGTPR